MHGSFAAAEHELANKSSEVVHLDRYCVPPQLNATALSQEAVVILYPARNFLPTTITLGQELIVLGIANLSGLKAHCAPTCQLVHPFLLVS
jgi:hypothetical protein